LHPIPAYAGNRPFPFAVIQRRFQQFLGEAGLYFVCGVQDVNGFPDDLTRVVTVQPAGAFVSVNL